MNMKREEYVENSYKLAKEVYLKFGVDVDSVLKQLAKVSISLHCWQGDDVHGFQEDSGSSGGLIATGNYFGRARNADELREDLSLVIKLVPSKKRINLHAIYADTYSKKVERNELTVSNFKGWLDWAKEYKLPLDFNPTFFAHPLANSGFTLSHPDKRVRQFWIEHAIAARNISFEFGRKLGTASFYNVWIPDGMKDIPADRFAPRERLLNSLDIIFKKKLDKKFIVDVVEGKLFGIGSESYVVGSYDFYLSYAVSRQKGICLDMGHFHPTEQVADKISSIALFVPCILLHVSRGIRWDSDHVVILNDDVKAVAEEVVRHNILGGKVAFALDFFDATINRVAAWIIGARALLKAILIAMLEPYSCLKTSEEKFDYTERIALMEAFKTLPFGAVWNYYCLVQDVPLDDEWLGIVRKYEADVLSKRQ